MTLSDFFDEMVMQYRHAESVTKQYQRQHIYRRRQHTISSIAEDMFAALLSDSLENAFPGVNLYFMVDYPMQPGYTGSRMFPDIAIVAEAQTPVLVSYLDLKTDLGFKRNYDESFQGIAEQVLRLRHSKVTGTKTYEEVDIQISPYIKCRMVVISECNMSSAQELNNIKQKAYSFSDQFKLYFLSGKSHPNEKRREQIAIYENCVFNELIKDLKQDINCVMPSRMEAAEIN